MAKQYEEKFKKMIVAKYLDDGISVTKLSKEFGIAASMVYKWINIFKPQLTCEDESYSQNDIDELRKKINQLEVENDILKKATAIFAQKK